MKTIFLILFIGSFGRLLSQPIRVLEDSTKQAVQYAHIVYYINNKIDGGTYTNKDGVAHLKITEEIDSIKISCLGFTSKSFTQNNIPPIVYLNEKGMQLKEVSINPDTEAPTVLMGFEKERKSQSLTAFTGYQNVTLIKNPYNKIKQVKAFVFHIKPIRTDKNAKLKVIFFKNDNGKPGNQIEVAPIVTILSKKRRIEVKLDSLFLMIPKEGLFAGIEWMGCVDDLKSGEDEENDCNLAIIRNDYDDELFLNQTFTRLVFHTDEWYDVNKYWIISKSVIPVFGLIVYE